MKKTGEYAELEALSRRGRWLATSSVASSGAGHLGGSLSAMDLLVGLGRRYTSPTTNWAILPRFAIGMACSSLAGFWQLTSSTGTIDVTPGLE